jgi:hypothetical protein
MDTFLVWVPGIGLALGFLCLLAGLRDGKRKRLVDNLPTSKTTGVFIGLVELKGTAESERPLRSYLAGCPCVHYAWSVAERWTRTVIETYSDGEGRTQTRTRQESGWTTVAQDGASIPFYLQDDCGVVLVRPQGAKIEAGNVFSETCGRGDALYYAKGPGGAVANSDGIRRFQELAIPLHCELYLMGQARERADMVAPEIAEDKTAPMYLISVRSEEQVSRGFGGAFWGWVIGGLVLSVAGFIGRDVGMGLDPGQRWWIYVLAAIGYLAVYGLCWVWMVFNSMVDLRQRVRQGWSQVDVQLKRRCDLMPSLVNVVQGYANYEKNLQTELAALRSELTATPPGVSGPDYRAMNQTVIAIAERNPELKANETFRKLQQNLSDTEQRIALARGYFNDIATFYNTRLERVPDRFVAALAAMKIQPLMQANDFERAVVEVELAKPEPVSENADSGAAKA